MLRKDEMETHISMMADTRDQWEVYSDDPTMIKKFDKIATAHKTTDIGKYYILDISQIIFKKLRVVSDEQKTKLKKSLKNARAKKQSNNPTE